MRFWTPMAGTGIIRGMKTFQNESLSHDAIHGYIPFTSHAGMSEDEISEARRLAAERLKDL